MFVWAKLQFITEGSQCRPTFYLIIATLVLPRCMGYTAESCTHHRSRPSLFKTWIVIISTKQQDLLYSVWKFQPASLISTQSPVRPEYAGLRNGSTTHTKYTYVMSASLKKVQIIFVTGENSSVPISSSSSGDPESSKISTSERYDCTCSYWLHLQQWTTLMLMSLVWSIGTTTHVSRYFHGSNWVSTPSPHSYPTQLHME